MGATVRVVIVEDNSAFRETLEMLLALRPGLEVVGAVERGADAVELCAKLAPDVAVIDYRMPGLNGAQTAEALRYASPRTRVVCLTASMTAEEHEVANAAGAFVCLTKDQGLEEIVTAIHTVADSD